jgi:hypothetical protein
MLLAVLGITVLVGIAIASAMRLRARAKAADLGWMSEQWLAEHRASHST